MRNNIIDIWSRFPKELCEKIIGEFDEKVIICQKEGGKILNKALVKKYLKNKDKEKKNNPHYDWESIKREKCLRIVYNDKIIGLIKKKSFIKSKILPKKISGNIKMINLLEK